MVTLDSLLNVWSFEDRLLAIEYLSIPNKLDCMGRVHSLNVTYGFRVVHQIMEQLELVRQGLDLSYDEFQRKIKPELEMYN